MFGTNFDFQQNFSTQTNCTKYTRATNGDYLPAMSMYLVLYMWHEITSFIVINNNTSIRNDYKHLRKKMREWIIFSHEHITSYDRSIKQSDQATVFFY